MRYDQDGETGFGDGGVQPRRLEQINRILPQMTDQSPRQGVDWELEVRREGAEIHRQREETDIPVSGEVSAEQVGVNAIAARVYGS